MESDQDFDFKYKKYKYRVKCWENSFRKKNGRIPSKHDIRDAPSTVRDAYKIYFELKTSMLEQTLNDALCDLDESEGPSHSTDESKLHIQENLDESVESTNQNDSSALDHRVSIESNDVETIEKCPSQLDNMSAEIRTLNEIAWGSNLCNVKVVEAQKAPIYRTTSKLSISLVGQTRFAKRNPRKMLQKTNSNCSQTSLICSQESSCDALPDFEMILIEKAQQKSIEVAPASPIKLQTQQDRSSHLAGNIDHGWLMRCTQQNSLIEAKTSEKIEKAGTAHVTPAPQKHALPKCSSYGISNLNVHLSLDRNTTEKKDQRPTDDSVSDAGSVISDSEDDKPFIRHALKKRKVMSSQKVTSPQIEKLHSKEPNDDLVKQEPNLLTESKSSRTQTNLQPIKSIESAYRKTRRITRPRNAKVDKCEALKEVSSENEDVFSNYDSDADQEYMPDKIETSPVDIVSAPKQKKTYKTPPALKATKAKTKTGGKKVGANTSKPIASKDDTEKPEEIVFTIDRKNNLPRLDLKELNKSRSLFENYVRSAGVTKNVTKTVALEPEIKEIAGSYKSIHQKITSGKLNENFVRINLKKKVFVKGKRNFNFSSYKKKQWKKNKQAALTGPDMDMGGCDGGFLICHQCGQQGHFASKCPVKGESLLPIDVDGNDSPFVTLDEAEQHAKPDLDTRYESDISPSNTDADNSFEESSRLNECIETTTDQTFDTVQSTLKQHTKNLIPVDFLRRCGFLESNDQRNSSEAIYKVSNDGSLQATPDEVYATLRMFGHSNFRSGQEKAIMRIMSGISTLVTLSTGSGKSLCYQLPAYLYSKHLHRFTLVVSPLVSLMEDQVLGVPSFIRAYCLHTNQTPKNREQTMEAVRSGEIDILLVSPEAVVSGEKSSCFGFLLQNLPPIAFACIDEAHCVSQWSHNFRPSYLMICKVLQEKLGIKTILGLTATATFSTRMSIVDHLKIPDREDGVISDIPLPDNLLFTVSKDARRENSLIALLRSPRFAACQSVIVYCTRRDECERIASFLRTSLQDQQVPVNTKKRKRVNWIAEAYHAGLAASRRRTIQSAFMGNDLRIVVATIAFGMGINKSDIRAVIHYNMPRNFESYVQEVGRAGRDGELSHCHAFLDAHENDQNELRRHIYANSIDRHVLRKLLQKVFVPCACARNLQDDQFMLEYADEINALVSIDWNEAMDCEADSAPIEKLKNKEKIMKTCPGHEVCFSIESTVKLLDIPEENIATILCYLELHENNYIQVMSKAYTMCKVLSYGGARQLKLSAQICPPLAMAIAIDLKNGITHEESSYIEFSAVAVASAMGWDSGMVKRQLKNLEWKLESGQSKRSLISVSFFDLGFRILAPGDVTGDKLDDVLDSLNSRVQEQERTQLIQLQSVFEGLSSVAFKSYFACTETGNIEEESGRLKEIIRNYFKNENPDRLRISEEVGDVSEEVIVSDIRTMISQYPENNFTGKTLARIFYGVQSPNYPAVVWSRCKFWRAHMTVNFYRLVELANKMILDMRS